MRRISTSKFQKKILQFHTLGEANETRRTASAEEASRSTEGEREHAQNQGGFGSTKRNVVGARARTPELLQRQHDGANDSETTRTTSSGQAEDRLPPRPSNKMERARVRTWPIRSNAVVRSRRTAQQRDFGQSVDKTSAPLSPLSLPPAFSLPINNWRVHQIIKWMYNIINAR